VTLADILPTLGGCLADKVPAHIWPDGMTQGADGDLRVGGVSDGGDGGEVSRGLR
jgi:hypothetical protein